MILLVEDEPILLESMEEILSFAGYQVKTASAPREALQILGTGDSLPDLIVSDILMPGMDGFQFLATVREQFSKRTPFLFISGQEATNLIHDPAQGKIGYLSKPFNVAELLDMVARILN
jgi:CheY-like chemotaxis protein